MFCCLHPAGSPLVAQEIRTGLFALRVFEEIFLVLLGRTKMQRSAPPKPSLVAADVRALEKRWRDEWMKRNKPSEFGRVSAVLLGIAASLAGDPALPIPSNR